MSESHPPEPGFSLFDAEEKILAQAKRLQDDLKDASPAFRETVFMLTDAYRRSVREQKRLVKVSDRLQAQLASLNQELAKRQKETQDALERLKETQDSLVQSEKLASLGALVGGVAHEINTPIGVALACASHLSDSTRDLSALFAAENMGVSDFEHYLDTATETARLIQTNCERAADLIRSFKQVAVDRTSQERRHFDLATCLSETLASLAPHIRQAGHRVFLTCPDKISMDGFPGAVSQVVTNLVMNSIIHAFEPGQMGKLELAVTAEGGDAVLITYADDGKGIPPSDRPRIFDPFFTTKRGQGGTGLGLHILFNLVTGPLEGAIRLDEDAATGTRFILTLARRASENAKAG